MIDQILVALPLFIINRLYLIANYHHEYLSHVLVCIIGLCFGMMIRVDQDLPGRADEVCIDEGPSSKELDLINKIFGIAVLTLLIYPLYMPFTISIIVNDLFIIAPPTLILFFINTMGQILLV